jgi:hypothetical protein
LVSASGIGFGHRASGIGIGHRLRASASGIGQRHRLLLFCTRRAQCGVSPAARAAAARHVRLVFIKYLLREDAHASVSRAHGEGGAWLSLPAAAATPTRTPSLPLLCASLWRMLAKAAVILTASQAVSASQLFSENFQAGVR